MGIFNEFFKKEKPIFTGLKFGFGSSGGPTGPSVWTATGGTKNESVGDGYIYHVFEQTAVGSPNPTSFVVTGPGSKAVEVLVIGGGGGAGSMPSSPPDGENGANPGGGGGGAAKGPAGSLSAGTYPVTVGAGGRARGATAGGPSDFPGSDTCLLYTSPSPRDLSTSRMPSSA